MKRTPEDWYHYRATFYTETQVLFHLNQAGVIKFLSSSPPSTSAEISQSLGLKEPILSALLEYVFCVDEILSRDQDGRYSLSEFGRQVIARFSRSEGGTTHFNFFDVRVGGYEPIWTGLQGLLKGTSEYGRDILRRGEFAADGLYKMSVGLVPVLKEIVSDLEVEGVVELGVSSGMLQRLDRSLPGKKLFGLDRNPEEIRVARERAHEQGTTTVNWVLGDVYTPAEWRSQIQGVSRGVFFTAHFHEFMAAGKEAVQTTLKELRKGFPGWSVIALEQFKAAPSERETLPYPLWAYGHSQVLIHHLSGKGSILQRTEWIDLFSEAGFQVHTVKPTNYLGYTAMVLKL